MHTPKCQPAPRAKHNPSGYSNEGALVFHSSPSPQSSFSRTLPCSIRISISEEKTVVRQAVLDMQESNCYNELPYFYISGIRHGLHCLALLNLEVLHDAGQRFCAGTVISCGGSSFYGGFSGMGMKSRSCWPEPANSAPHMGIYIWRCILKIFGTA